MIAWTKIKTTAACAAALLLTASTTTLSIQNARLSQSHARLQSQSVMWQEQLQTNQSQNDENLLALQNENRRLREQVTELHRLRGEVGQLRNSNSPGAGRIKLNELPESVRPAAEKLRELQYEQFIVAGSKALAETPLTEPEKLEYSQEMDFMKHVGLALRIYATDHQDQFPDHTDGVGHRDERSASGPPIRIGSAWQRSCVVPRDSCHNAAGQSTGTYSCISVPGARRARRQRHGLPRRIGGFLTLISTGELTAASPSSSGRC